MKTLPTELPGVIELEPNLFHDERGFFFESYSERRYQEAGLNFRFVQDNHSCSRKGVILGLHYQLRQPQAKIVRVVRGTIYDVAVDIRLGSPTYLKWVGRELSARNHRQLFIPVGFAHGFCALEEGTEVEYKCTDYFLPGDDHGVRWSDSTIGIEWPVVDPIVSQKDRDYPEVAQACTDFPTASAHESGTA